MSELDVLREVAGQLRPPEYDDLVAVARKRRRRSALGAAAGAAVVVLAVVMAGATLSGGQRSLAPAEDPSPSRTGSTIVEWTPERIRAEGRHGDPQGAISTESGLATRLYEYCDGTRCDFSDSEDVHVAIEVTQAGRSAVFDLHWYQQPWVRAFDRDSVLVQDPLVQGAKNAPARFRLLQADGTAVEFELLDNPAATVPGPDVVLIDRYDAMIVSSGDLYLIDDRAGTMRPLDVPAAVRYWGPNVDEFLWGVTDDCRVVWATAGTFKEHQFDCPDGPDGRPVFSYGLTADEIPAGWLLPGRMVVDVHDDKGNPTLIQVSLDRGVTWQRIPIGKGETIADVLQRLG